MINLDNTLLLFDPSHSTRDYTAGKEARMKRYMKENGQEKW